MGINIERIKHRINAIAEIGKDDNGGNTRIAFTKEDKKARTLFIEWMKACNMSIRIDTVGNIVGRYEGKDANLKPLAVGSHLDTVPSGGRFDGVLGCVAGLECVEVLNGQQQRLNHPIEVIVFADEEGSRFGTILLGSRAMIGTLQAEEIQQATDNTGITAWEAMNAFELDPQHLSLAQRNENDLAAYLEMHIEQGAVLYSEQKTVGIVTGIVGIRRFNIWIEGEANHAGTTPFKLRKDALLAAAKVIQIVKAEAQKFGNQSTVATVGQLQVWPGAVNVVAGKVRCSLEIRDVNEDVILLIEKAIRIECKDVATREGVLISVEDVSYVPPVPLSPMIQDVIREICNDVTGDYLAMPSGAGHDAQSMAKLYPTGMIFVPSKDGISHSPREYSSWADIEFGSNVLFKSLQKLDEKLL